MIKQVKSELQASIIAAVSPVLHVLKSSSLTDDLLDQAYYESVTTDLGQRDIDDDE